MKALLGMLTKDSRGNDSRTLTFIWIAFSAVIFKFVFAEMTLPLVGRMPYMGGDEFGIAVGAILAVWVGREWTDKRRTRGTVDRESDGRIP